MENAPWNTCAGFQKFHPDRKNKSMARVEHPRSFMRLSIPARTEKLIGTSNKPFLERERTFIRMHESAFVVEKI
jgi:hypothetical protein